MLISIKEINENKRYVALFEGGKTTKFGQTNPKKGTYVARLSRISTLGGFPITIYFF